MRLLCISISYHNTPVELRECLVLTTESVNSAVSLFPIRAGKYAAILEIAFLSTCNRLEIYALVAPSQAEEENSIVEPVFTYLREALAIDTSPIEPYFRTYTGNAAVEHLFQVAAGLDSIAIGEAQILGQVSHTLDVALQNKIARHVLASLFRAAIHAGKRVQSETEISRRPVSISSLAVDLVAATLGPLTEKRIIVIGAGKMGGLLIASLREHGAQNILLANRTRQRADELAQTCGCQVLPFEDLPSGLKDADVVFASTGAPKPIITRTMIAAIMAQRPHRPLTLMDLAVPRNVEQSAGEFACVLDMDDLQQFVGTVSYASHQHIAMARSIVESEAREYEKLLRMIPFIGELHKKVEQIRQYEVARTIKHLSHPDADVLQQIDLLSRALVRKILHEPTMHLRTESDQETLNDYVGTLARLFDLSEGGTALPESKEQDEH